MITRKTASLLFALLATTLAMASGLVSAAGEAGSAAHQRLEELTQAVVVESDEALAGRLEAATMDSALLPLERDQLMLAFIDHLRGMAPGSIGPSAIQFLLDYRPQATRPDEHQPVVQVPVYNIGAAAQGLVNSWRRQESAYAGAVLLTRDPSALVRAYAMHEETPVRLGLIAALDGATRGQLEMVSFMALSAMDQEPALAALAGEAALRIGDARALEQVVRNGSGSAVTHILRASGDHLSAEQTERLLDDAIAHARPEVAAVAIAELAPRLVGRPGADDRMFALLGDQALGASAALVLASNPSDTSLLRLGQILRGEDNERAAGHARLALDLVSFRGEEEAPR